MYINNVILLGRLGKDPVTYGSGTIMHFSLCTSRMYRDSNGERREEVSWHNIEASGKVASFVSHLGLKRGDPALVQGRLVSYSYTDKESGERKYGVKIVASNVQNIAQSASNVNAQTEPVDGERYETDGLGWDENYCASEDPGNTGVADDLGVDEAMSLEQIED